jgi:hypothetical protein
MKSSIVALSICTSLVCASALAQTAPGSGSASGATAPVKPGLWETTTVVENPTTNSRRSVVGRTCITAADASNPQRIVPPQREPGMQCENQDIKRDGAGWAWNISCKSADGGQKGSGKMSVSADSYVGRAEVEQQKKGAKPVKVGQTFSGKWIQACS